jgi:SAM-dependent methyltransferase
MSLSQQHGLVTQPDVRISLTDDVPFPLFARYVRKKQILAQQDREITVYVEGEKLFSTLVPKGVFNPYVDNPRVKTDAMYFVHSVMKSLVDVADKDVIDLGCGCGVVGLACICAGASSVLFTDINKNVARITNPLIRPQDKIKVQDLLNEESDQSHDVVIMSAPIFLNQGAPREINPHDVMSGLAGTADFNLRVISEAGRVLRPGGALLLSASIPLDTLLPYHRFLMALNKAFDLNTMVVFNDQDPEPPLRTFLKSVYRRYALRNVGITPDRIARLVFKINTLGGVRQG